MSISFWQIAIVALLAILFFGRGRIPELMGDIAKGITSFKKEMAPEKKEEAALASSDKVVSDKSEA